MGQWNLPTWWQSNKSEYMYETSNNPIDVLAQIPLRDKWNFPLNTLEYLFKVQETKTVRVFRVRRDWLINEGFGGSMGNKKEGKKERKKRTYNQLYDFVPTPIEVIRCYHQPPMVHSDPIERSYRPLYVTLLFATKFQKKKKNKFKNLNWSILSSIIHIKCISLTAFHLQFTLLSIMRINSEIHGARKSQR